MVWEVYRQSGFGGGEKIREFSTKKEAIKYAELERKSMLKRAIWKRAKKQHPRMVLTWVRKH